MSNDERGLSQAEHAMAMTILRHRREHSQYPLILVVGGTSVMWDQKIRGRGDLFVFWLSKQKSLPLRPIPPGVGLVILSRATQHATTSNAKLAAKKAGTVVYPGVYDTRPIERALEYVVAFVPRPAKRKEEELVMPEQPTKPEMGVGSGGEPKTPEPATRPEAGPQIGPEPEEEAQHQTLGQLLADTEQTEKLRSRISDTMRLGIVTGRQLSGLLRADFGFERTDFAIRTLVKKQYLVGERLTGEKTGGYRFGRAWDIHVTPLSSPGHPIARKIDALEAEIAKLPDVQRAKTEAQAKLDELAQEEERLLKIKETLEGLKKTLDELS